MKITREWRDKQKAGEFEAAQEITEDRASRELANVHGDNALEKLAAEKELSTQYARYRVVE